MGRRRKAWLPRARRTDGRLGPAGKRYQRGEPLPGWYVCWNEYPGGERVQRTKCFDTAEIARRWRDRFNARRDLGELGELIPITLGHALREFLGSCSSLALDTQTHYGGALRMLRGVIGSEAFWEGIRTYYGRHFNGNANTDDFRRAMEEASCLISS